MNISRESIFISSLRSFCMAFFAVLGITACVFLAIFVGTLFKGSSATASASTRLVLQQDDQGKKDMLPLHSPAILKIDIEGVIGDRTLTTKTIEAQLADSRVHFLKNGRVKGILLNINTPGGTVTDSNGIYEALLEYKKRYKVPIYAFVNGMCASGGMYITSAAEKTYASNVSLIGSVGVILGPAFNFIDLLNKYGVQVRTIATGKNKGMLNPFGDWKENSDISLQHISTYLYSHFVDLVTAARPRLNKDLLINEYGAQIYAAPEAERLGFIDHGNSTYSEALKDLVKASGIESGEKYQVIQLKPHISIFQELLNAKATQPSLMFNKLFNLGLGSLDLNKHPFLYLYRLP